jgi:hypothetical protein
MFLFTSKMKIFADKNICGNNICGHKMNDPGPCAEGPFCNRENIYHKYFYPQIFGDDGTSK